MKKKIFFGHWFYLIGSIILLLVPLGLIIFIVYDCLTESTFITQKSDWLYVSIFIICFLIMFVLLGYHTIHIIVMDNKGIKVRCLWGVIRKVSWEDIKEVRYEQIYISIHGAFSSSWYVFDDGTERPKRSGIVGKNSQITLPASKRAKKAIEEFWRGEIKNK